MYIKKIENESRVVPIPRESNVNKSQTGTIKKIIKLLGIFSNNWEWKMFVFELNRDNRIM